MVRVASICTTTTTVALLGIFAGTTRARPSSSSATTTTTKSVSSVSSTSKFASTPSPTPVTLRISTKSGVRNKTAPLLHGLFFEDINHSGDGGLYGELIQNRAFQGSGVTFGNVPGFTGSQIVSSENAELPFAPTLTAWRAIGGAHLSLDKLNPLSSALPTVLRVDIPQNATGEVGFLNEGWWGIDVKPQSYNASFYIKPSGAVNFFNASLSSLTVSLRSNLTDDIWASSEVSIHSNLSTFEYTQFATTLTPTHAAPSSNNTLAITFNGTEVAGETFYFSLVSLFAPTFKNRRNGLRKDLAEVLVDLKPKFLRFPGGNNLEGVSIDTRWQWKKTIGPLTERPGRVGDWTYFNTDGLGFLEFLEWCEDMEIEPLLSVYAGYSLSDFNLNPANTVPQSKIQIFIDEALEELEYAMGDVSTTWGALRAEHGHPEPFNIKHVEIGNEDWFSDSYYWRFPLFMDAIKAKYPNITIIATQATESSPANRNTTIPPGAMWDLHHYETPQFFKDNFNYFDNWNEITGYEGVTLFVGEYSVLSVDRPGGVDWVNGVGRFKYPGMIAAVGEAIYGLAMERNPNVVKLSSYAPLLQNFNSYEWTPNFIAFTANPNDTVKSTSYYQQKMFSSYMGTETLPIKNTGDFDPIWWHAAIDDSTSTSTSKVYVKLVNAAAKSTTVTINLDIPIKAANGTILHSDDELAFNYLGNATAVAPVEFRVKSTAIKGETLRYELPGLSVVVLELR